MELHSFQQNTYSQSTSVDWQFETPTGVCKWTVGLQIVTTCSCLFNHLTCPYRHWQDSEKRLLTSSGVPVRQSVRPSVRLEGLGSQRKNFHKILYFNTPKICLQIQV